MPCLTSRVRLARNLPDFPFGERLTDDMRKKLADSVSAVFRDRDGWEILDTSSLSHTEKAALAEQHLISREFAAQSGPAVLIRSRESGVSVMVPEEDHIRLQAIRPGLDLRGAYEAVIEAEEMIAASLDFAFDGQYGYLTRCPTNLGTGMRASVMLHLPMHGKAIPALAEQLSRIGLTVRGMSGEGSGADAALCQISNRITLGISEEEILEKTENAVRRIADAEREKRAAVTGESLSALSDRVMRALGTVMFADRISSSEMLELYSLLRLGSGMKLVNLPSEKLDEALFTCMPNTILSENPDAKTTAQRDRVRAEKLRRIFGAMTRRQGKSVE